MAAAYVLPFEKPVVELVVRVRELRDLARSDRALEPELRRLEDKTSKLAREIFAGLTPWQKVQLSRHPNRPYTLDYVSRLFEDFIELHGDRSFGDDASIVGGLARFHGRSVVVIGHQKGRGAKDNVRRNFGMPHPEGYRKALRLYEMADRFGLPVLTLIDTPRGLSRRWGRGARPGRGHRGLPRGDGEGPGAHRGDHHRRGRERRRSGARRRQPRARDGIRNLQRHLARGLRVHPLEGRRAGRRGGHAPADDARPSSSELPGPSTPSSTEPAGGAHQDPRCRSAPRWTLRLPVPSGPSAPSRGPPWPDDRYARFRRMGAFA